MDEIKKLTILHSNDMHGDFLPSDKDGVETGGLSRLSGYINQTRQERKNVLYMIAGDMFKGSIIDSEFRGISTIDMVSNLRPDVATIGNHEVDYGIGHLLFLEKCAKFPIVNANLFVTMNNQRLFTPYVNLSIDGMRILVIGILTSEVLDATKLDKPVGTYVDVKEAAREVGIICDNYRTVNTDMTVLLTHIGIENDVKLAELLNPSWGVDMIIGGHSHTFMEKPEIVNNVPIVQAGTGTGVIGRIEVQYDTVARKIVDFQYRLVPVNENTAPKDEAMESLITNYRSQTEVKYKRVVTRWARKLTHPCREQETEMGNLYADAMQWESSFDIMLMGSGSIRKKEMGPVIEYKDMLENTPYDDCIWMLTVTGEQWRRMIKHIMRDDAWKGETEFYQFSKGVKIVYNRTTRELLELKWQGQEVTDDMLLKIALQNFHYESFDKFLGVPLEEVKKNMRPRVVATSLNNIVEEFFMTHEGLDARVEGRITLID
ncbi:MAG: bifunctional metallophosphatase/5'-nucleotidase [Clostridia bacterium]|nr:bifunctional metallophosphatase/5'-nucleotidase [Clostridia bacterium]